MRKRILSMLCSVAILCTMLAGVANAQTVDSDVKCVDGSYLQIRTAQQVHLFRKGREASI